MKLDHKVMHPIILKGFVFMIHTIYTINLAQSGTAVINCPDIAFLDNSAGITCSTSVNFNNTIYYCPCGPAPQCSPSFCTSILGYNVSIVSRTQTELTILSAQPRHAGNWSCSDGGGDEGKSVCNLILTKIPSVTITSDVDADSVNLGDIVALTVDIGGYYCSGDYSLTLQVGSVNYTLGSGRSNTNRNLTETIPINVTQTHLGDVKLDFDCDNHLWNITPEGVHQLQPNISRTPTCNITSDKDTETLTLQEEVTLTVDVTESYEIRGSKCSAESDFTLQTGLVKHVLNVGDQGLQPVIFNVAEIHLGGVRLVFNCQHQHWNLTCDGVTQLSNKMKPSDEVPTASNPIIIAAVVVSLVFIIVVAIIIVFRVKRKVSVSTLRHPPGGTVHQTVDNVAVESGFASGNDQYAPVLHVHSVFKSTTVDATLESCMRAGGDYLHPDARGEYMALDRNAVQPSNIYEHLTTYEQISNM